MNFPTKRKPGAVRWEIRRGGMSGLLRRRSMTGGCMICWKKMPTKKKLPRSYISIPAAAVTTISHDLRYMRSINPDRGCEHGCNYCDARPSHGWLGYSAGLDFETQIFYKPDAPEILRRELAARNYVPQVITLGSNTDCYQPAE